MTGAPTSLLTEAQSRAEGVPLANLDQIKRIDLTVDGADEFDAQMRLIKGGGAALLREKIIADFSERMIVIADESKEVDVLGRFALPVEVNPFGLALTRIRVERALEMLGMNGVQTQLREKEDGAPLMTDGGHYILDLKCGAIPDPESLGAALDAVPGVVEHGLFIGLADGVIIGTDTGVRTINL